MQIRKFLRFLRLGLVLIVGFETVPTAAIAQAPSLFTAVTTASNQLNDLQLANYNKVMAHVVESGASLYTATHFITTNPFASHIDEGKITINLPFMPCPALTFNTLQFDYTSDSTYSWDGDNKVEDSICFRSSMNLVMHDGILFGHITVDNRSFEIYDLSGGIQLLCETNLSLFDEHECASDVVSTSPILKTTAEPCEVVKTKVLVLYNQEAANVVPYAWGEAYCAVQQVNTAWQNSGYQNSLSMVQCLPFSFNQTGNSTNDVQGIASNAAIAALRNQYKAEIVVMLVGHDYNGIYGDTRAIGGAKSDAFAVVSILTAANGRHTFAHEIGHILGAKHDNDGSAPTWARDKSYLYIPTQPIPFNKVRTLMALLPSGKSRIEYISNDAVYYMGVKTGEPDRNNVQRMNDLKYHVADFYTDYGNIINASIAVSQPGGRFADRYCNPNFNLTANHTCGTPPFTYSWYVHNGATGWTPVGSGKTISGFFNVSPSISYATKSYMVYIQDAVGSIEAAYATARYECFVVPKGGYELDRRVEEPHASIESQTNVSIAPNPSNGRFTLRLLPPEPGTAELRVTDVLGREVFTTQLVDLVAGYNNRSITLPIVPDGNYIMHLTGKHLDSKTFVTLKK